MEVVIWHAFFPWKNTWNKTNDLLQDVWQKYAKSQKWNLHMAFCEPGRDPGFSQGRIRSFYPSKAIWSKPSIGSGTWWKMDENGKNCQFTYSGPMLEFLWWIPVNLVCLAELLSGRAMALSKQMGNQTSSSFPALCLRTDGTAPLESHWIHLEFVNDVMVQHTLQTYSLPEWNKTRGKVNMYSKHVKNFWSKDSSRTLSWLFLGKLQSLWWKKLVRCVFSLLRDGRTMNNPWDWSFSFFLLSWNLNPAFCAESSTFFSTNSSHQTTAKMLFQELVESKQPLEGMEITFEAYTNEDGSAVKNNRYAGKTSLEIWNDKKQRNARFL